MSASASDGLDGGSRTAGGRPDGFVIPLLSEFASILASDPDDPIPDQTVIIASACIPNDH
jgi:hypothetical protein